MLAQGGQAAILLVSGQQVQGLHLKMAIYPVYEKFA